MQIHPSAIIDPGAQLGQNVVVEPYAIIGPDVIIGDDCVIGCHSYIMPGTRMGKGNRLAMGVVLGGEPQDVKFKGEQSFLVIGDNNTIREYATLHRASGEGAETVVGDNNLLMAYSHIGHNGRVGNNVTMANCVQCGGHMVVDDYAVLGGCAGVHQFAHVGMMCMIGAYSVVRVDVPHYLLAEGIPARPRSINLVGLRRRGLSVEAIDNLRSAFKLLYRSELNTSDAVARIKEDLIVGPEVQRLIDFVQQIPEGRGGRQHN